MRFLSIRQNPHSNVGRGIRPTKPDTGPLKFINVSSFGNFLRKDFLSGIPKSYPKQISSVELLVQLLNWQLDN